MQFRSGQKLRLNVVALTGKVYTACFDSCLASARGGGTEEKLLVCIDEEATARTSTAANPVGASTISRDAGCSDLENR